MDSKDLAEEENDIHLLVCLPGILKSEIRKTAVYF